VPDPEPPDPEPPDPVGDPDSLEPRTLIASPWADTGTDAASGACVPLATPSEPLVD
jgi:hypothetical protein